MPLTPTHHPSAQALANLLIGDCSPGVALLARRHLEVCPQCAARLQAMGSLTGSAGGESLFDPVQVLRPGLEIARARGASGFGEAVLQIRAAPGTALPLDEPLAALEILVLDGGVTAEGETYRAGDFVSLEERPLKDAVSDRDRGCVCLLACQDESGLLVG
jgi:anti-sigma factor ChrR (cupin superfamily)